MGPHSGNLSSIDTNCSLVKLVIGERVRRTTYLPAAIFADPAWDILLELFRAELCQERVSVSNLCIASQVPFSTALRWISRLQDDGLICRSADPIDGRRYYIRLTYSGSVAMNRYFTANPSWKDGTILAPSILSSAA